MSAHIADSSVSKQSAFVEKVLTGNTVQLKGGKILKYASIEVYPLQSKIPLVREYGQKALAFNESLVGGKTIEIQWGPRIRDTQNRLLGYVFLADGRFVNKELLAAGHAKTKIVVPNLRYVDELRAAEDVARNKKLGLWEKEPKNPFGDTQFIGEKNTKIYYFPRSRELERIPEAQLVRFNSRVEATAAGYRPCYTCHPNSPDESE